MHLPLQAVSRMVADGVADHDHFREVVIQSHPGTVLADNAVAHFQTDRAVVGIVIAMNAPARVALELAVQQHKIFAIRVQTTAAVVGDGTTGQRQRSKGAADPGAVIAAALTLVQRQRTGDVHARAVANRMHV